VEILILNGPNLNLLGKREPHIYGRRSFEDYLEELRSEFTEHKLDYFQANGEEALINKLHEVGFEEGAVVINAGGFSHTSVALADAISAISRPVIAVHISNTFAREAFRHQDYIAAKCKGLIAGLGLDGYRLAIQFLTRES
jgi:3-dehydroquinate dehydratase-2